MRYLIAIPLPPNLAETLRRIYQETYKEPLKVEFLHTTLIPPFTVADSAALDIVRQTVNRIPELNPQYVFGNPDVFANKRTILYLPLHEPGHPQGSLYTIYHQLLSSLRPHITVMATDFQKDELPEYKPHVTLSYSFSGDPSDFKPPTELFSLPKPQLLEERGPGLWTQSGHNP